MNICVVHQDLNSPLIEGVQKLGFELCCELARQGHRVHVVTGVRGERAAFPVEINGVCFHGIPRPLFAQALPDKLKHLDETEKFHIIHFQNTLMLKTFIRPLSAIVQRVRVPTVAYMCMQPVLPLKEFAKLVSLGSICDELWLDPGYYLAGLLTPRILVRAEFNLVDRAVASSDCIRNHLVHIGIPQERTRVVYPFIDIGRFVKTIDRDPRSELMVDENDPLVLYIGSVQSIRLGVLLRALSQVARSVRNLKVVFVAKYVNHKLLGRLADTDLAPAVRLLTSVRHDIAGIIATSDAYVFPGFSSYASVDPPLSLIEAMILGVPVVASETGGIPEIAENTTLVRPSDHVGMANELTRILTERRSVPAFDARLKRLREGQYPGHAKRFDVRSAARQFIAIYEDIQSGPV